MNIKLWQCLTNNRATKQNEYSATAFNFHFFERKSEMTYISIRKREKNLKKLIDEENIR